MLKTDRWKGHNALFPHFLFEAQNMPVRLRTSQFCLCLNCTEVLGELARIVSLVLGECTVC